MHVNNTLYFKFTSNEENYVFRAGADSESVTSVVIEIPEEITLSATSGHYALNIPKIKNLSYLKIIVNGKIEGAGGMGRGGGIMNWNNAEAIITGKGRVRGGGAETGLLRYAIYGNHNIKIDPPRIFHF